MPDPIIEPTRVGAKDKERIDALERAVKALLQAMREYEKTSGEALMPIGDYYGYKFEE